MGLVTRAHVRRGMRGKGPPKTRDISHHEHQRDRVSSESNGGRRLPSSKPLQRDRRPYIPRSQSDSAQGNQRRFGAPTTAPTVRWWTPRANRMAPVQNFPYEQSPQWRLEEERWYEPTNGTAASLVAGTAVNPDTRINRVAIKTMCSVEIVVNLATNRNIVIQSPMSTSSSTMKASPITEWLLMLMLKQKQCPVFQGVHNQMK